MSDKNVVERLRGVIKHLEDDPHSLNAALYLKREILPMVETQVAAEAAAELQRKTAEVRAEDETETTGKKAKGGKK